MNYVFICFVVHCMPSDTPRGAKPTERWKTEYTSLGSRDGKHSPSLWQRKTGFLENSGS